MEKSEKLKEYLRMKRIKDEIFNEAMQNKQRKRNQMNY